MMTFAGTIRSFAANGPLRPAARISAPVNSSRTVCGLCVWDQSVNRIRVQEVVTMLDASGVLRIRIWSVGSEPPAYSVPDRSKDPSVRTFTCASTARDSKSPSWSASTPKSRTSPTNSIGIHGLRKSYQRTTSVKCVSTETPIGVGGMRYGARSPNADPSGGAAKAGDSEKLSVVVPQHGWLVTLYVALEIVTCAWKSPSTPLRYISSGGIMIWTDCGPWARNTKRGCARSAAEGVGKNRSVTPGSVSWSAWARTE